MIDDRARELVRELADWATACKGNQEHFEAICARKISTYGDERAREAVESAATVSENHRHAAPCDGAGCKVVIAKAIRALGESCK